MRDKMPLLLNYVSHRLFSSLGYVSVQQVRDLCQVNSRPRSQLWLSFVLELFENIVGFVIWTIVYMDLNDYDPHRYIYKTCKQTIYVNIPIVCNPNYL